MPNRVAQTTKCSQNVVFAPKTADCAAVCRYATENRRHNGEARDTEQNDRF